MEGVENANCELMKRDRDGKLSCGSVHGQKRRGHARTTYSGPRLLQDITTSYYASACKSGWRGSTLSLFRRVTKSIEAADNSDNIEQIINQNMIALVVR